MGTITVRTPQQDDMTRLVDVYVKARRSYYEGHVPEEELADWERSARAGGYDLTKPGRVWLCAELDGEFAGFALVTLDGELLQLQVDPACWGNGLGLALHDAAMGVLRDLGATSARLEVFKENHRAQRFYTARGWCAVGRNDDHVRMALDLNV